MSCCHQLPYIRLWCCYDGHAAPPDIDHAWYHSPHAPARLQLIAPTGTRLKVRWGLHIGKSFSLPGEIDSAAQRLTEEVQAAYSAATTPPTRTDRRWDLHHI
ncbi:hypothetical protein EVAR_66088_1 [Eumeta japonica]|uniref:Uncharacterized protein n=1 Tax=Eumeta variegata TaxID=151549 RepID=A0A4C1ZUY2_EUMVA|nr:hypothetical protein EVAR_66088_1 [Eumeta japonica]